MTLLPMEERALARSFIRAWGKTMQAAMTLQAREQIEPTESLKNRLAMAQLALEEPIQWGRLADLMERQCVLITTQAARGGNGISPSHAAGTIMLDGALSTLMAELRYRRAVIACAVPRGAGPLFARHVAMVAPEIFLDVPSREASFVLLAREIGSTITQAYRELDERS